MRYPSSKLQQSLYCVFLLTCAAATVLGLLMVWGVRPDSLEGTWLMARILGTCIVLAVASAFTMSATRLAVGPPPEDDRG